MSGFERRPAERIENPHVQHRRAPWDGLFRGGLCHSPDHTRGVSCRVGAATSGASGAINFVLNKVLLIATAAILGKEGFLHLKGLMFDAIQRHVVPDAVGPVRHGIGPILFVAPLVLAWIAPYAAEIPPALGRHTIRDGVIADAVLIVGLFVLGGGFWEKLRALFARTAVVAFPEDEAALSH